jgi:hypothetical protein
VAKERVVKIGTTLVKSDGKNVCNEKGKSPIFSNHKGMETKMESQ